MNTSSKDDKDVHVTCTELASEMVDIFTKYSGKLRGKQCLTACPLVKWISILLFSLHAKLNYILIYEEVIVGCSRARAEVSEHGCGPGAQSGSLVHEQPGHERAHDGQRARRAVALDRAHRVALRAARHARHHTMLSGIIRTSRAYTIMGESQDRNTIIISLIGQWFCLRSYRRVEALTTIRDYKINNDGQVDWGTWLFMTYMTAWVQVPCWPFLTFNLFIFYEENCEKIELVLLQIPSILNQPEWWSLFSIPSVVYFECLITK